MKSGNLQIIIVLCCRGSRGQSGYDAGGDLTSQSDGLQGTGQHVTGCGYDQLGRKISLSYPDGSAEQWRYDASGNQVTYIARSGHARTTQYDGRNRPTVSSWDDGLTAQTNWTYDAASRVTDVSNWHADVAFTYDDAGEVLQETEQIYGFNIGTETAKYNRDIDGNIASMLYPRGKLPSYAYDNQQRCTGMNMAGVTYSQYNYSGSRLTGR